MNAMQAYRLLLKFHGPQGWWPLSGKDRTGRAEKRPEHEPKHHNGRPLTSKDRLEIMIGAILTQNTSWTNAEKAISLLNKHDMIDELKLNKIRVDELAVIIRSAGYYNQKARAIKALLSKLHLIRLDNLRQVLLSSRGIGPETADSIILYAFNLPSFVVDAYTKRIFSRLGLISNGSYDDVKVFFEGSLPQDPELFNEYHALIVAHGKSVCKKVPDCQKCILNKHCSHWKNSSNA